MAFVIGVLALGGSLVSFAIFLLRVLSDVADDNAGSPYTTSAIAPLTAWIAIGSLGAWGVSLLPGLWPVAMLVLAGCVLLAAPSLWVRFVAIPMGWPRSAYFLSRLSVLRARTDPVGVAMMSAAWAAGRQKRPSSADLAWVTGRVKQRPLTPGMCMALGLVAAARGDRDEARQFLACLPLFDQGITDPMVERLAREWRTADAAQRGDWREVVDIAQAIGPSTPATRWLGAVAQRLLGLPDAPSEERLEALWKQVPGQRRTEWLQQRARAAHTPEVRDAMLPDDVVDAALHAQLLLDAHPSRDALAQAASCWSAALPELEAATVDRAIALGSHTPHRAVEKLHRQVAEGLSRASKRLGAPVPTVDGLAEQAAADHREQHLRTLELAGRAMEQRLAAHRALPPVDELREWLALKHLIEQAAQVGGDELLRVAFRPVYVPCCTLSVRLYNHDGQPWLSNAITRWLLKLAHRVGDDRAIALQSKNLAAVSS